MAAIFISALRREREAAKAAEANAVARSEIRKGRRSDNDEPQGIRDVLPHQQKVRIAYNLPITQAFMAILIFSNFIVSAVCAQVGFASFPSFLSQLQQNV